MFYTFLSASKSKRTITLSPSIIWLEQDVSCNINKHQLQLKQEH
jgi:hypothetical protein